MTTDAPRLDVVTAHTPSPLRRRLTTILVHVLLIGASIAMLYPLLWMLSASVRP